MSEGHFDNLVADAVIAQYCSRFDAVNTSALDVVRELFVRYIEDFSDAVHDKANYAGRTQVTTLDVLELLCQDVKLDELFWHGKLAEATNRSSQLVRLPGRLSRTRKPKLPGKISEMEVSAPGYIPSHLQVLPSTSSLKKQGLKVSSGAGQQPNAGKVTGGSVVSLNKDLRKHIASNNVRNSNSLTHFDTMRHHAYHHGGGVYCVTTNKQFSLHSTDNSEHPTACKSSFSVYEVGPADA